MPKVLTSSQANIDLLNIYLYVARESKSVSRAERLLDSIATKCAQYAENPEMGSARDDLGKRLRIFPCGTKANPKEWVVIYRAIPDGIEIVRVFRGKRDYPSLF